MIVVTPTAFLITAPHAYGGSLTTRVLRRDGTGVAWLDADVDYGVVRFDDGKVEIVGTPPEGLLFCAKGDRVRPFAECRQQVEVRGRFRL